MYKDLYIHVHEHSPVLEYWYVHTVILGVLECYVWFVCRPVPCNAAVQYESRTLGDSEAQSLMEGENMSAFLEEVYPR